MRRDEEQDVDAGMSLDAANVEWDGLDKRKFVLGGAACALGVDGTLHPLELIKTRLQVQGQAGVAHSSPVYSSVRDAMRQIGRQEGFLGFFKGFAPAALTSVPTQLVYFGVYEYSRHWMSRSLQIDHDSDIHAFCVDASAGALGELASGVFWVPSDMVSQRLMLQGPNTKQHLYSGMTDAARKIWRAEGPQGFFVGFGASMFTHIPGSAMTWAVYEYSRKVLYRHWFWPRQQNQSLACDHVPENGSHVVNLTAGLLGGAVGGAITTPFDVVRVRKQAEGHSAALHGEAGGTTSCFHDSRQYRGSTLRAMRMVVQELGPAGLFRGMVPRILFSAPQAALALVIYEVVKNYALKPR